MNDNYSILGSVIVKTIPPSRNKSLLKVSTLHIQSNIFYKISEMLATLQKSS